MNILNKAFRQATTLKSAAICLLLCLPGQSDAVWYETQGQSVVLNGDKVKAKRQATEEALRQAMLFAGASVRSVQQLTNGLLNNDHMEIVASGEVQQLELISENWHNDVVTVKIRADIFPAQQQCPAENYSKTIATSYFPLLERQHAQDGQIQELGRLLSGQLKREFDRSAQHAVISSIEPYTVHWQSRQVRNQATALATQTKTQFVLTGVIEDLSVHRPNNSALAFWQSNTATRSFRLRIELIDGINGAPLLQKSYETESEWDFDRYAQIDASSNQFWRSAYGKALQQQLQQLQSDVDETLACVPATGHVISISAGNELNVSLGRQHGLQPGDSLSVYQVQEVTDYRGEKFIQYHLYPVEVEVIEAYADNARVKAKDERFLANIQPNDFVAKR
ncbi:MAG: flagella assembly protein FlgT [Alteromonadaceae bacterium]|nr:flagella assembly protein FlgT [Alteromonadaceae bacterium]